jgi:hypothetical protein
MIGTQRRGPFRRQQTGASPTQRNWRRRRPEQGFVSGWQTPSPQIFESQLPFPLHAPHNPVLPEGAAAAPRGANAAKTGTTDNPRSTSRRFGMMVILSSFSQTSNPILQGWNRD